MSHIGNDYLLEKYYYEFLEEGYSEKQSDKLARKKLNEVS